MKYIHDGIAPKTALLYFPLDIKPFFLSSNYFVQNSFTTPWKNIMKTCSADYNGFPEGTRII